MEFVLPDKIDDYVKSLAKTFSVEETEEAKSLHKIIMDCSTEVKAGTRSIYGPDGLLWFHEVSVLISQELWTELDLEEKQLSFQSRLLEELEKLIPKKVSENVEHVEIKIKNDDNESSGWIVSNFSSK